MPEARLTPSYAPEFSISRSRLLILIAMALCTARLIETPPLQSANDRSRWATALSLVERGTYQIDEVRQVPGWDSIDKVRHEGHYYSSKPPLLSTIVAGGYWAAKHGLGWTIKPEDLQTAAPVSHLILFLINIIPTAIALECLSRMLYQYSDFGYSRMFILATACFGTLWSAFLPSLNNHTPAICCVMIALWATAVTFPERLSYARVALAGFMAAFAVTLELPALAFFCGLVAILFLKARKQLFLAFLPAAILPAIAHFYTNYLATGDWRPFYASYGTEKYLYFDKGVPSYWLEPQGLDRATDSFMTYLFHCTLGHHGLLSLTPVLLISILGFARREKWKRSPLALYYWLGAALTAVVFGYFMTRTANYNYGGVSVALRWMLWLIPFWLLMMLPAVDLLAGARPGRIFMAGLLAGSIFSAWNPYNAPWKQPWLFTWMQSKGWINYTKPAPEFATPRRSWISQVPTSDATEADYWVELTGVAIDGSAQTLKVLDGGPETVMNRAGRRVHLIWNEGFSNESRKSVVLDVERLNQGLEGDLILWPDDSVPEADKAALKDLIHGLPAETNYRCANERYMHLPLRTDAFKCQTGVGWAVRASTAPGIPAVQIRSEFWSSPEIPFGVANWSLQTTSRSGGQPLAQRRLALIRSGKLLPAPKPVTEVPLPSERSAK